MSTEKGHPLLAKLCGGLGLVLIVGVVLLCLPLTVPRLFGYEAFAIISGSMEPTIPTGSLVYAKPASPAQIEPGDVAVFYTARDSTTAVTHRVVENDAAGQQLITRGDANDGNDPSPVPYPNVVGVVVMQLPLLGYFLPALAGPGGKLYLLCLLVAAVLLRLVAARMRPREP